MPHLLAASESIPMVAIAGGLLVAIVSIISGAIRKISLNKQREESRREIAAYVAEGSMTADEGERLMNAGNRPKSES